MADIICGVKECKYNEFGECSARTVEIDEQLTAAGFQQICKTYEEED